MWDLMKNERLSYDQEFFHFLHLFPADLHHGIFINFLVSQTLQRNFLTFDVSVKFYNAKKDTKLFKIHIFVYYDQGTDVVLFVIRFGQTCWFPQAPQIHFCHFHKTIFTWPSNDFEIEQFKKSQLFWDFPLDIFSNHILYKRDFHKLYVIKIMRRFYYRCGIFIGFEWKYLSRQIDLNVNQHEQENKRWWRWKSDARCWENFHRFGILMCDSWSDFTQFLTSFLYNNTTSKEFASSPSSECKNLSVKSAHITRQKLTCWTIFLQPQQIISKAYFNENFRVIS